MSAQKDLKKVCLEGTLKPSMILVHLIKAKIEILDQAGAPTYCSQELANSLLWTRDNIALEYLRGLETRHKILSGDTCPWCVILYNVDMLSFLCDRCKYGNKYGICRREGSRYRLLLNWSYGISFLCALFINIKWKRCIRNVHKYLNRRAVNGTEK